MKYVNITGRETAQPQAVFPELRKLFTEQWIGRKLLEAPRWNLIYWGIILFGIVLRARQFFFNRSLWRDEAALALNVTQRNFAELLQPLEYAQGAPPGFLLVSRFVIDLFGNHDYVLRLIPFLAGIAALVAFSMLAKRFLSGWFLAFALLLFSVNGDLIYYSSEFKQYSSDVLVIVLLLLVALKWRPSLGTFKSAWMIAIAGAIAIWFSHPAVFVVAGIGIYQASLLINKRFWKTIPRLTVVAVVWGLSGAALYFLSLSDLGQNPVLLRYWSNSFIPFPTHGPQPVFERLYQLLWRFIRDPGGLDYPRIVLPILGIGSIQLARANLTRFALLLAPLPFILLGAALKLYPLSDRLVLFAVPLLIIGITKGLEIPGRSRNQAVSLLSLVLAFVLIVQPVHQAVNTLVSPRTQGEVRAVLDRMENLVQPGDTIYVYHGARLAYKYYAPSTNFPPSSLVFGTSSRKDRSKYIAQIENLKAKGRVWFLFSHVYDGRWGSEEEFLLDYLDTTGIRLRRILEPGASAYLYDLTTKPGP